MSGIAAEERKYAQAGLREAGTFYEAHTTSMSRLLLGFGTTIIHFLAVESRCVFAFYISFKKTFIDTMAFIYSRSLTLQDVCTDAASANDHKVTMGMNIFVYNRCWAKDIKKALGRSDTSYEGVCLDIPMNHWGRIALSIEVVVLSLIFVEIALLVKFLTECFRKKLHCTFSSGRYMSFTWNVVKFKAYKVAAYLVVVAAAYGVGLTLFVSLYMGAGLEFITHNAPHLILLVVSAVGLLKNHEPSFAKHADVFSGLVFNRGLVAMVHQSNDEFAKKMEQSLYQAAMGQPKHFAELVDYHSSGMSSFDQQEQLNVISKLSDWGAPGNAAQARDGTSFKPDERPVSSLNERLLDKQAA